MFRNLNAEQARYGYTNAMMGEMLGMSRVTYEKKKKTGTFSLMEAKAVGDIFEMSVDYLFQTAQDRGEE